jgi:hypothetical protein
MSQALSLAAELAKKGPSGTIKAVNFFICRKKQPVNLCQAEEHHKICWFCQKRFIKFDRAEKTRQYINLTGWWDPYQKGPLS